MLEIKNLAYNVLNVLTIRTKCAKLLTKVKGGGINA